MHLVVPLVILGDGLEHGVPWTHRVPDALVRNEYGILDVLFLHVRTREVLGEHE